MSAAPTFLEDLNRRYIPLYRVMSMLFLFMTGCYGWSWWQGEVSATEKVVSCVGMMLLLGGQPGVWRKKGVQRLSVAAMLLLLFGLMLQLWRWIEAVA